jgi:hypothetical protein
MLQDHKDMESRLRKICEQAIAEHTRLDLYDFVTSYDSALKDLMDYLRIERTGNGSRPGGSPS